MKSQKEINAQIKSLKAVRPKVRRVTAFGDDNLAKLDAQVKVLEDDLDSDDVWDEWPSLQGDMEIRIFASDAIAWREGDGESDDLSKDWPLI